MTLVILRDPKASHGNVRENCVQTNSCIITKGSWLIMLSADLIWLCMSEVWEPLKAAFLYLTHLFGNWVDGAEKQINSDISFCFVFLSAHLCAATLTACLVAPRSKKKRFSKCTGPDCGLRYLMLDHFSNCNISERQICSFTLYEIQVGLFHFAPNWKSHFTGCFSKLCYSEMSHYLY